MKAEKRGEINQAISYAKPDIVMVVNVGGFGSKPCCTNSRQRRIVASVEVARGKRGYRGWLGVRTEAQPSTIVLKEPHIKSPSRRPGLPP